MNRQEVGKLGEKAARKFLKKRGYHIRETGFRCRHGEIDIIAQRKDCLVFLEVRTKSNLDFGTPEESITQAKKREAHRLSPDIHHHSRETSLSMAHRRRSH